MNEVKPWRGASIYCNKELICIQTTSGYGGVSIVDTKAGMHLLPADAGYRELGEALRSALSKTRFVLPGPRQDVWIHPEATFDLDLYDYRKGADRYQAWIRDLMDRYGYKTKRSLFKDMLQCQAKEADGVIELMPMRHVKLEAWEGKASESRSQISASSETDDIGKALRDAIGRCS